MSQKTQKEENKPQKERKPTKGNFYYSLTLPLMFLQCFMYVGKQTLPSKTPNQTRKLNKVSC